MLGAIADILNKTAGAGLKVRFAHGAVLADPQGYVFYIGDKWVPRLVNCPPELRGPEPDDLID